jgi:pimeloyl-ACP methyl ester carboxylesterase
MKKRILIFSIGLYLNVLALIAPRRAGRIGFFLFCRPRRRPVKQHHHEFLNSSEKFMIEYAGKKVQGYRWGTGEKKVLLLHGWESHSYWWKSIVNSLSKDQFTLYSIDAPGHGLSEGSYINIPHYSALIEQLVKIEGEIHAILGHSLGAFSSVYTLHRVPKLPISKLVVMASPGEAVEFFTHYQKILGLSRRSVKVIGDYFVEKLGYGPDYFSLKTFASTLQLPGLIIHDTDDKEAPYQHGLEAHQNWKNSEMITTTGLGHNLKSNELLEKVNHFLNSEVLV